MALAKSKHSTSTKPSSGEINIGIGSNSRKEVAACLNALLADTYMLQLKTQFYHWNVTGSHFIALHEQFGAQYAAIAVAVDEVAERVRAIGHFTNGTFRDFAASSDIKEDKALPAGWEQMVSNLVDAHETISRNSKE